MEQSLTIIRRHGALYAPWVLLGVGILGVGLWYWRSFYERPPWGLFALLLIVVVGLAVTLKFFLEWHSSTITISPERFVVVDQRGLFERHVSEIPFEHILDIGYHIRGFSQVIVGYGTIEVRSSATRDVHRFQKMPKPRLLRDHMVSRWQEYRELHPSHKSAQTLEEARIAIEELQQKFGKEALRALLDEQDK